MAAPGHDFLKTEGLQWPSNPPLNKIDTHHHWVPDEYAQAVSDAGGDPSGWPIPVWSLHATEMAMHRVGASTSILSITAPGPCILQGEASYKLARSLNNQAAAIRDSNPAKFGFLATLPSALDTEPTLNEIRYALDELGADGVTLFTRYGPGNHYLGHTKLEPIWQELNKRKAVVFIHPTHPSDTNLVSQKLLQPLIDYPHETTRTAMDMLLSGTKSSFPDCKIILSHAGGTLPYLVGRVAMSMAPAAYEQFMTAFRSFYFDIALSTSPTVLDLLLNQVPHNHITYGSDFPYAPPKSYPHFLKKLEDYSMSQALRDKIYFENALALFPRLRENIGKL